MKTSTKKIERHQLPDASMGNRRTLKLIRYGDRSVNKKAYLQAGLHADEPPGYLVMHHLINLLDRADAARHIQGEIVLVPVANPIGVSQWNHNTLLGRFDTNSGINFNRRHLDLTDRVAREVKDKFTAKPKNNIATIRKALRNAIKALKPMDETEYLKRLLLSFSFDADIVLDLHCDFQAVLHVYMGTPLWPAASDLSAQMGAHATLLTRISGGHPFDEACSRIWWELAEKYPDYPISSGCLSATLELRGSTDVSHDLAVKDAKNIFIFLQRRGLIKGRAPALPSLVNGATPLRAAKYLRAPGPGVVIFLKKVGEKVKKGEPVIEIVNPLENKSKKRSIKIKSSINGLLVTTILDRYARPGRILALVAGKKPIKSKGEDLLTL